MTERPFIAVRIAVLTVSDTRTMADDKSGQVLADRIVEAGHQLIDRAIVTDDVERIRARLMEAEQGGFTSLSPEQIRTEIRREVRRDKDLLEPTPKLAAALKKLEPLPSDERLPDVDEGQLPLDRNPLG